MSPGHASTGFANYTLSDAEHLSHHPLGEVALPDEEHVGFGEFGVSMIFSDTQAISVHGFFDILDMSGCAEMGWLNTNRSVTRVQDFLSDIDLSVIDLVRCDVRVHRRSPVMKLSISSLGCASSPIPAFGGNWRAARMEPHEGLFQAQASGPLGQSTSKRIAVRGPAVPVRTTPPPSSVGPFTSVDRTLHIGQPITSYDTLEESA